MKPFPNSVAGLSLVLAIGLSALVSGQAPKQRFPSDPSLRAVPVEERIDELNSRLKNLEIAVNAILKELRDDERTRGVNDDAINKEVEAMTKRFTDIGMRADTQLQEVAQHLAATNWKWYYPDGGKSAIQEKGYLYKKPWARGTYGGDDLEGVVGNVTENLATFKRVGVGRNADEGQWMLLFDGEAPQATTEENPTTQPQPTPQATQDYADASKYTLTGGDLVVTIRLPTGQAFNDLYEHRFEVPIAKRTWYADQNNRTQLKIQEHTQAQSERADAIHKVICQKVYASYKDEFDFFFLTMDQTETDHDARYTDDDGPISGKNHTIRNDVQNIGMNVFDGSSSYGSNGKLRAFLWLPYPDALRNGPALHELAHTWANYIVPTVYSSHWGISSANGQLGGFDPATLQEWNAETQQWQSPTGVAHGYFKAGVTIDAKVRSFNGFSNGGNAVPFGKLDLYLMGLIPFEEAPKTIVTFKDVQDRKNVTEGGLSFKGTRKDYNLIDLVKETRVPDSASSPKNFNVMTLLLQHPEAQATQLATCQRAVAFFGGDQTAGATEAVLHNFVEATGGKGTLTMNGLEARKKATSN